MPEVNWNSIGGTLLATLLGSFTALWAQGAPVNRGMRAALYSTLGFVSGLLFLVGVVGLVFPATNLNPWVPIAPGLVIALSLWPPFRRLAATVLPIDARLASHAVGLMVAGLLLLLYGALLLTTLRQGRPTLPSISPVETIIQHGSLVVLSFFAVGLWLRRRWGAALDRLGLVRPQPAQLLLGLIAGAAAAVVALIGRQLLADGMPDVADELSTVLLGPMAGLRASPPVAVLLAFSLAIGTELFFRGALQPRLGLPLTSVTYAAISSFFAPLGVLLIFLALGTLYGLIRERANTVAAIAAQALFNLAMVVLILLR